MKRILAASSIAAFALVGLAGTANAAPSDAACFGQVHKTINTEGALGFTNVGDVVKAIGGQGKNETARGICAG
ncbi:hypothetical protein SAMN05192575_114109 [Nocardioides alpinus]|uniref:Secreted protein n=1 Tax=Nocardioides alpinus TaxID=748909 RepID=A0A1I1BCB1_9ACTN|nr:hypothetical protein [Nocardioides alpinus]PKH41283.1 hypothetical protein CXG46_09315 [Nocardioides alpinus]SFB46153.1 hypothetical protein SAMN05192575_114109 [Nocardioides alpinus]